MGLVSQSPHVRAHLETAGPRQAPGSCSPPLCLSYLGGKAKHLGSIHVREAGKGPSELALSHHQSPNSNGTAHANTCTLLLCSSRMQTVWGTSPHMEASTPPLWNAHPARLPPTPPPSHPHMHAASLQIVFSQEPFTKKRPLWPSHQSEPGETCQHGP